MKVSEFFGKRVLSTSGKEGYVISVNASGKNLYLLCADDSEREFAVDVKSVKSVGTKIVYEDGESQIISSVPLRLGRAGYDEDGRFLGVLEDFTLTGGQIKSAKIGKKTYPAEALILGDVVIVKKIRRLKSDVKKDGNILFKKGTCVTAELLQSAALSGEYVQTTLKTI